MLELFIVLSIVHEKVQQLKEKLEGRFSNLHPAALPNENGTFEQDLTRIVNGQSVVIILGDIGEIHMDQSSSGRKWVSSLDSPAFRNKQLQNVFYIRFGTDAVIKGYMENLQHICVREHPKDNDFDPAYVAKFIHERITEMMLLNSRNQLNQRNHLDTTSTHSITPQLTPHNRLSTSDLGSELSENSWKGASNETKTEDEETHYTDGQVTDTNNAQVHPSPPVNPAIARLRASSHASSTSGGLESASATSVRTTGKGEGEAERGDGALVTDKDLDKTAKNSESTADLQSSSTASIVLEVLGNLKKEVIEAVENVGKDVKIVEGAVESVGVDVKKVEGAVKTVGENFEKEEAEMKDRMEGIEQDIEHVAGVAEQARKEAENQNFETIDPYSDDEGRETGDLGSAPTREDSA